MSQTKPNKTKRRGVYMRKTKNYMVRNIDKDGRLVEGRKADDMRLPLSPLTYEEYIKCRDMITASFKKKEELLQEAKNDASVKLVRLAQQPGNPFYDVFVYLSELRKKKIETGMDADTCVICGETMHRSKKSEYPYCQACARTMMVTGEVRGRNNTLGYLHWQQPCVVCHKRLADLNMKGMCRVCYRLGERHHTRDPEEVRKIRREQLKKEIQEGKRIPSGNQHNSNFFWGKSNWDF